MPRHPIRFTIAALLCLSAAPVLAEPPLREIVHKSAVQAVAWSADGKLVATGSQDGVIRVTEAATGKERGTFNNQGAVKSLVFSHDGSRLGVKTTNGPLSIWDVAKGQRTGSLALGNFHASHLAFSRDGSQLSAAGVGQWLTWSHTKGSASGSQTGNANDGCAGISLEGHIIAWSTAQGAIQCNDWEARHAKQFKVVSATALAFGPEAHLLAVGGADKSVRLLKYAGGGELHKLEGLAEPAKHIVFSANGKTLAAVAAKDSVIRVWDVATGRLRRQLAGTKGEVSTLALSPDGRTLAVTTADLKALLWNVALREVVRPDPPLALGVKEMQSLWGALGGGDYDAADEAFRRLAAGGDLAVPFLKQRLRAVAVPAVDYQRIEKLVNDLDSPRFAVREKASVELAKYGELAENALRKLLLQPTLEVRRRAEKLMDKIVDPPLTPERVRALEALQLLESLGTPEARLVLEEIGHDGLLPLIRLEAVAALGRLKAAKATP